MAEPQQQNQNPSRADLEAENKRLREALAKHEAAKIKAEAEAKAELEPAWWRCLLGKHQSNHLGFMGCLVKGNGRLDAQRQFCSRMGIRYVVVRNREAVSVAANKVTDAELAAGARPDIGDDRVIMENLGPNLPPIAQHVRIHPTSGNRQALYNEKELKEHGYKAEDIATVV